MPTWPSLFAVPQAGHVAAVDVVHELAPAEKLADEPLDRGERDVRALSCCEDRAASLFGRDQAQVERHRQQRVGQHSLPVHEGVLVRPERWEAVLGKVGEGRQRTGAVDRPGEAGEVSRVVGEALGDVGDHLPGDGVGRERERRPEAVPRGRGAAILGVEAPGTAGGPGAGIAGTRRAPVAADHEPAGAAAVLAVPGVQAEVAAAGGPVVEVGGVGEPEGIRNDGKPAGARLDGPPQRLGDAGVGRLHDPDLGPRVPREVG